MLHGTSSGTCLVMIHPLTWLLFVSFMCLRAQCSASMTASYTVCCIMILTDINILSGTVVKASVTWCLMQLEGDSVQALQEDGVKVMTINPAQVSTPMTWSRPDSEYIPDLMIQPQEIADLCVFAFKVGSLCMLGGCMCGSHLLMAIPFPMVFTCWASHNSKLCLAKLLMVLLQEDISHDDGLTGNGSQLVTLVHKLAHGIPD